MQQAVLPTCRQVDAEPEQGSKEVVSEWAVVEKVLVLIGKGVGILKEGQRKE